MSDHKPPQCIVCPLYKNDMAQTVSASDVAVLFLFSSPDDWNGNTASLSFRDRASDIVKRAIYDLYTEEKSGGSPAGLTITKPMMLLRYNQCFMYAVQCLGSDDTAAQISTCAERYTHHAIGVRKPKVIVTLGTAPLRSLRISGKVKDLRGTVLQVRIAGDVYNVVPTVDPSALLGDDAGLYSLLKKDIARAARVAYVDGYVNPDISEYTTGHSYPRSIEELDALTTEYLAYRYNNQPVSNCLMALDTETNTLVPWSPDAKIIMVSAAVAPGKACGLFLEHRAAPYDWRDALPYVLRLTMSEQPKAWWNLKFDHQMFKCSLVRKVRELAVSPEYKTRLEAISGHTLDEIVNHSCVRNTRWDGLLGEHMLDEDKKGYYGLKVVVADYVPNFSGYEEKLTEEFRRATEAKLALLIEEYKDPVYTSVFGLEDVPLPFTPSKPGLRYSELLVEATDTLEQVANLRRGQTKKNYPTKDAEYLAAKKARLRNTELRIEGWVKNERSEAKKYASFLHAYVTESQDEADEHSSRREGITYEDIDPEVLQQYAAIDADVTYQACRQQRVIAHREDPISAASADGNRQRLITLMDRHYLPLTYTLSEMQEEGVWVDKPYLRSLTVSIDADHKALEKDIREQLHLDLGVDSSPDKLLLNNPKTLSNIFVAYYGLPVIKNTAKGAISVDEDTLLKYAAGGNEVAGKVLTWRKLGKAKTTYVDSFLNLSAADGCIHGNLNLNGTSTGRCSSSDPNLQNTPLMLGSVNIKQAFIPTPIHEDWWWESEENRAKADKYGWVRGDFLVWMDLDFSGAEVRVLTRYAPDKGLIDALLAGQDIHSWMTAEIHGYTYDEVNVGRKVKDSFFDHLRSDTKRVVFGTLYGITAQGLEARMGFTEERAQEIINKLMNRFPAIQSYIQRTRREITSKGYVVTPHGRFRRFPMVRVGRWMESRNHRQGVNYKIQSYCSDIVLSCLQNIAEKRLEMAMRLLFTVHDSVCAEFPYRLLKSLPGFLERSVKDHIKVTFPDIPVPMPYDVSVGPSYGVTMGLPQLLKWLGVA